jgi:hypothetical protein
MFDITLHDEEFVLLKIKVFPNRWSTSYSLPLGEEAIFISSLTCLV